VKREPLTHDFAGDPVYDRRQAELIEATRRRARERILTEQRSRQPETADEWSEYAAEQIELAKRRALDDGRLNVRSTPATAATPTEAASTKPAALRAPNTPRRITVTPTAWATIRTETRGRFMENVETGGLLIGECTDRQIIASAATIYADETTERTAGSLTSSLFEIADTPRAFGAWHIHPHATASISGRDIAAGARVLDEFGIDRWVELVVSTGNSSWDWARGMYTANAYLFQRSRSGEVTYETLAGT
jgi:hypothetical protein